MSFYCFAFLLLNFMGLRAERSSRDDEHSPTGTRSRGYSVASSPGMKKLRWLLNLLPNLAALLTSAVGWLRAPLLWPRRWWWRWRRRRRMMMVVVVQEGPTQALEPEVSLEEKEGQGVEEVAAAPQAQADWIAPARRREVPPEHFEISFNFVRHLFDMTVVGFLCLASPVFRVVLDVLGLRGLLKLWLHGMALFLVASYGMVLVLWLLQAYIVQLALLFGAMQLMVLGVSLRQQEEVETQDSEGPVTPPVP
ncbi:uncharacterized protein C6orf47 homolog [Carcharodon carcharias]|uniref:uncharacterized protein C6orf47 homolog n=1 Tax=Carcharodon carcharias TaxID=13397 RepID=UPI001B7DE535|nr:uncharacterized protein C6orf47 homolog [Carcharodon carcharias]